MTNHKVPIEISARHVHLSGEHLQILFGSEASLTEFKKISQPGQFAAAEFVAVRGPKGELQARVVGPVRAETQVELTVTECRQLGITPKLRVSGNLEGTSGCELIGPAGRVVVNQGVVVAQRHLHISPEQAAKWQLKHGDIIAIKTTGTRPITFHDVYVRSRDGVDELSFMLDTDEGNAAGLRSGDEGVIV